MYSARVVSKDVECWSSYLPVPGVTSSHWLRGVGPWPSHEFDHKGCIIVEEEAQAGGDQREEDLHPAAGARTLLEAGKITPTAGDSRSSFFLEQMDQLERSN